MTQPEKDKPVRSLDFIRAVIADDMKTGKYGGRVHTRFPPEPNGYLHIGHAKAIYLDFILARENGGLTNLRFDDTNPVKEEHEYVQSIIEDVHWLGYDWEDRLYYASDYFQKLYDFAEILIKKSKAFVCDLSADEIREYRGTLTAPGKESPYRDRSVEENIDLFRRMRKGEFEDGSRVLRAKIDMSSGNLNLRDPIMYRILRATHHRTGDTWCIYPTYDFTHGQSDSIENITHSICTLEFEDHRPLYDWFLDAIDIHHPQQIEFARLNLSHTVVSKRKLRELVEMDYVQGWDDPRMPTLSGLRRRGVTPEAIQNFISQTGVSKRESNVDIAKFEHAIRNDLNKRSQRAFAVLRPLKLVITNYPTEQTENMKAVNNPEDPSMGTRTIPFSRELFIDREDFNEDPPEKFFRLAPGKEVRLRYAYIIRCQKIIKNESTGEIIEIHCTYDPDTKSGKTIGDRKVKGTLHWVSAAHAIDAHVRLYDRLFTTENPLNPPDGMEWTDFINPESHAVIKTCKVEPSLEQANPGDRFQFERTGYFCVDADSARNKSLVFNRTITLRDTWQKIQNSQTGQ
ncbi:MAG: glutamine--tRNA ligase/YqeY domain fusion protein [Candidatus Neomarinimicrobiota bacterium]